MIRIDGQVVKVNHFPDGTQNIKIDIPLLDSVYDYVEWFYENDEEMVTLYYIMKKYHEQGNYKKNLLYLRYVPNARMDRVKHEDEVFTLKYFCDFINSLKFETVYILDPHSDVAPALLNNVCVVSIDGKIKDAIKKIGNEDIVLFYPDNGAAKRYSDMIKKPYCFGVKNRDWETGDILGLDVVTNGIDIKGKDILIVDDICSKGGTFYHSAKKLKEMGANKIYLYITHCENTIKDGELLKDNGLIEKIYTTNSIYTLNEEKIKVV